MFAKLNCSSAFTQRSDVANISIKFTQAVIDQQNAARLGAPPTNGSLGMLFDDLTNVSYTAGTAYGAYASWAFSGTTFRINFADGAVMTYTGVLLANPDALSGAATATGFEFYANGQLRANEAGKFHLNYTITPGYAGYDLVLTNSSIADLATAFSLATLFPVTSAQYDKTFGNVSIAVSGAVTSLGESFSGSISKIVTTADKFLLSETIEGNFQLSGNELTPSSVTGTLTGYREDFSGRQFGAGK